MKSANLHDISFGLDSLELNETLRHGITELDNTTSVEFQSLLISKVWVDGRRADMLIWGLEDFKNQSLNILDLRK